MSEVSHSIDIDGKDNGVSYRDLYAAEQKKRQEAEKGRAELLEKYNSVVQDREKVIASIQMVSIKAIAGMLSDLQTIARQAPRFEALEHG